ncbi:MAG TPA: ABC transporter ATP-binding protein [Candidatus Limnocylindria bacterium]|nr:ABC transporter ATP-binding protein [Candidatus Limnocylindria bacterium]
MTVAAIATRGLTKDYGAERGLFDLDLEVPAGEVFGYLGPNGAGKTTTIRLLMGLIYPTRGSATIFGLDCQQEAVEVKRRVGYLPGELANWGGLRGSEVVAYLAGLRGGVDAKVIRDLAARFELDLGRRYREYSHGNKQKLALVIAFMTAPDLLILDEPTSGLDPLNQQQFYQLVREARQRGATTFLSSHILSEVEHACDRVGIIRQGRLVKLSGLDELHQLRVHQVEIEFDGEPPAAQVRAAAGVEQVQVDGHRIRCTVRGSFEPLLTAIANHRVVNLVSQEPSLEEIFLSYYQGEPRGTLPNPSLEGGDTVSES